MRFRGALILPTPNTDRRSRPLASRAIQRASRRAPDRPRISVVVADDHPIVLAGVEALLERESDIDIVARCTDGVEAVRAVNKYRPDVLILDLRMPRADGVAVLEQMHKESSPTRVVLLAAVIDDDALLSAIRLGARGVVLKETAPRFLVDCIREVHAGRQWFEQQTITEAMERFVRREAGIKDISSVLSRREIEVARAVALGLRNREIAERLGISEGTVKLHLHTIYTKLHVDGRMALVVKLSERAFV